MGVLFIQKHREMYTHNKFFKVFLLLIIAAYSYFHASLLEDISWLQSTVLLGGFIFAVFAHTKSGYLMIILLLVHMGIEWTGYVTHGIHSNEELVTYIPHVVVDFGMLWVAGNEVVERRPRFRPYVRYGIGVLVSALAVVFVLVQQHNRSVQGFEIHLTHSHTHEPTILELLVIGMFIGCTLSHIAIQKRPLAQNPQQ
jgi:hypothetical protein